MNDGREPDAPLREAELKCWIEWKRRCAIDRCGDEAVRCLRGFAGHRFGRFLAWMRRSADERPCEEVTGRVAWHLFETHLLLTNSRTGKRYKDWIFARVSGSRDEPIDVIQGGATLILRDVARNYVCAELQRSDTLSLDAPLGGQDAPTLLDLLAGECDPMDAIAQREYEAIAKEEASRLLPQVYRQERVMLLARRLGLPVWHPSVEEAAGCRKSRGNQVLLDFQKRIFFELHGKYAGEGRQSVARLAVMTIQMLSDEVFLWGKAEIGLADLFKGVKED
jgi:hypothetical protein